MSTAIDTSTASFFAWMGCASALVFANLGAAYGTAKGGVGLCSMGVMSPGLVMKNIIGVVMAGAYTYRLASQSLDVVWNQKNPYPWVSVPQTHNAHFMKLQSKPHDSVFKPQDASDLRGRI